MKYAIVFGLCAVSFICLASASQQWWITMIFGNIAIAFFGIALGFGFVGSRVLMKKRNGKLAVFSYILYWPFHLLNFLILWVFHKMIGENLFDEIVPGLYLGGRLWQSEASKLPPGIAVLDLTSEFNKIPLAHPGAYACIPLLDNRAPTLMQLRYGVLWIRKAMEHGPVYVHCAAGHGRSATFIVAYLLASKIFQDIESAIQLVRNKRPGIGLNRFQLEVVRQFLEQIENDDVVLNTLYL